tara:strand:- start:383 stop:1237 length:855 start_codon:yes stop_codon:yes gene_type:complete
MSEAMGNMETVQILSDAYKPEYAGGGVLGFADRLLQKGYTYEPGITDQIRNAPFIKEYFGDESRVDVPTHFKGEDGVKRELSEEEREQLVRQTVVEKQNWWRDYEFLYTLPERNRLFGATLTASEAKSWRGASINEGMPDDQIQANLKTLKDLYSRSSRKMIDERRASFWSDGLIGEYEDQFSRFSGGANAAQGPDSPLVDPSQTSNTTVIPQGSPFPDLISPTDWDTLDDTDKAEAMSYADEYGPEALLELMSELTGTPAPSTPTSFPLTTGQPQSGRIQRNN